MVGEARRQAEMERGREERDSSEVRNARCLDFGLFIVVCEVRGETGAAGRASDGKSRRWSSVSCSFDLC